MPEKQPTLICHTLDGHHIEVVPGGSKREWMDETTQSFAYRCLPLSIANSYGWDILCPCDFEAIWDGGSDKRNTQTRILKGQPTGVISHFGHGIITFHVNALFQTAPNTALYVTGPPNLHLKGLSPLTGIIETDWSPYTFTMNWQITQPNSIIKIQKGTPIARIFPINLSEIETIQPIKQPLAQTKSLTELSQKWQDSREDFNTRLFNHEPEATKEKWQKLYYRGLMPTQEKAEASHFTKLRVPPFKEEK